MFGKVRLQLLREFIDFALDFLQIQSKPKVVLKTNREGVKTYANFEFGDGKSKVNVYVKNRSLADIMRSIAHELVHQKQFEEGLLETMPQDIGGKIEDEANALAGQMVKAFGYKHRDIYE